MRYFFLPLLILLVVLLPGYLERPANRPPPPPVPVDDRPPGPAATVDSPAGELPQSPPASPPEERGRQVAAAGNRVPTAAGMAQAAEGEGAATAAQSPEASRYVYDAGGRPLYVRGEILLILKEGVDAAALDYLHEAMGNRVISQLPRLDLLKVKLAEGGDAETAISRYRASGLVRTADRHHVKTLHKLPDDPKYPQQYGLEKIQAPVAWAITTGAQDIVVAVVDTGVNYQHPDLINNIWRNAAEIPDNGIDDDANGYIDDIWGWDFGEDDNNPMDSDDHGTHVAGIIGAVGNNATGVAGVCWQVKIMALKATDSTGYIQEFSEAEALDYAINQGARVVNASYGGAADDGIEKQAIVRLGDAGILLVAAAGNGGDDDVGDNIDQVPEYPASFPHDNIIAVAASDQNDLLTGFSNFGPVSVDLMAPGQNILSLVNHTDSVSAGGTTYVAAGMDYAGITAAAGVSGVLYDCGEGCPADFPAEVSGNIALIERGNDSACGAAYFYEKAANAMSRGAIAAIIYDKQTVDTLFLGTLATSGDWIPVVSMTRKDGLKLLDMGNPQVIVKNVVLDNSYDYMQGTSMATPFVSGAAALLYAFRPDATYQEVRARLLDSVDPVPAVAGKLVSGGRLNVFKTMQALCGLEGDLTCDGAVGLADVILGLRLLADYPDARTYSWKDIDGDNRIGMAEMYYIMQRLAGLRLD